MIDHDHLRALAAPYALGLLSGAERRDFEAHLVTCAECRAELAEIRGVNEALALASPAATPPAKLRQQILDAAERERRAPQLTSSRSSLPWWLAAAASIAAIVAVAQWRSSQVEIEALRAELATTRERLASTENLRASAERATADATSRLAVLAAADSVAITLTGQPSSPAAVGRVVWSPSRGVVFSASNLPALPQGRVYQLWAVAAPAPVGIALISPADGGEAEALTAVPAGVAPTAFALTLEPEGGSPAPTGAMYLVGAR